MAGHLGPVTGHGPAAVPAGASRRCVIGNTEGRMADHRGWPRSRVRPMTGSRLPPTSPKGAGPLPTPRTDERVTVPYGPGSGSPVVEPRLATGPQTPRPCRTPCAKRRFPWCSPPASLLRAAGAVAADETRSCIPERSRTWTARAGRPPRGRTTGVVRRPAVSLAWMRPTPPLQGLGLLDRPHVVEGGRPLADVAGSSTRPRRPAMLLPARPRALPACGLHIPRPAPNAVEDGRCAPPGAHRPCWVPDVSVRPLFRRDPSAPKRTLVAAGPPGWARRRAGRRRRSDDTCP